MKRMNTKLLVSKRLSELSEKADAIHKAKTLNFISEEGTRYYYIDSAAFQGWATGVLNLLQRVFGKESIHFQRFETLADNTGDSESGFMKAVAVFNAAREDYEGGYLFNVESLIRAEVFDDIIEQASALHKAGYKDPACVVAGVTLETTLKNLCSLHSLPHGTLDKMNVALAKAGVYNKGMQKQITAWADRRNCAAHGEWDQYSTEDVADLISGVGRLIAEYS